MSHRSARPLPLAQSSLSSLSSPSGLCLLPHFHVHPTPHILIDFPELHYKVNWQQPSINVHLSPPPLRLRRHCLTVFMRDLTLSPLPLQHPVPGVLV